MYNATTRNTPRRRSSRIVFIVLITRYQQNNDRYCTRKEPQRDKLERLARYIARPAIACAWLKLTDSGQSRYTLKTPYRDGTTQVIFESGDFIARLAAQVPTNPVGDVIPGDVVTFDIVIDFTGEATMGGGLDITYDPTALLLASLNRDPDVGEIGFGCDPDILPGLLGSLAIGAFGAPIPAAGPTIIGDVSFDVLGGISSTTVVAVTSASGIGGPWIDGTDFLTIVNPTYNQLAVHFDTDGDPNVSDPDPQMASNQCTGGDADNAMLADSVSEDLTCAANESVDVQGPTQVIGLDGHLIVIAPLSWFQSGFRVLEGASLAVITAEPCQACGP